MLSQRPEYYRNRAADEREAAAKAPRPGIFRFHDELADMYDRMAEEAEREQQADLAD